MGVLNQKWKDYFFPAPNFEDTMIGQNRTCQFANWNALDIFNEECGRAKAVGNGCLSHGG